ncbi:hypothetical protein BC831DRAFT_442498, partial [Entophlyctis helioformis]
MDADVPRRHEQRSAATETACALGSTAGTQLRVQVQPVQPLAVGLRASQPFRLRLAGWLAAHSQQSSTRLHSVGSV